MRQYALFLIFALGLILLNVAGVNATSQSALAEYSVDANTLALYHLNNDNLDETGNYNLDANTGTFTTTSRYGSHAVELVASSSQYMEESTLLDTLPSEGTIEAWIRPADSTFASHQTILYKYNNNVDGTDNIGLIFYPDDYLRFNFYVDGTSYQVSSNWTTWSANSWYHIAGTWGPDGMQLWINGSRHGTNSFMGHPNDGTDYDICFGCTNDASGRRDYFNGIIDEIRISDIQRKDFFAPVPNETNVTILTPANITYYTNLIPLTILNHTAVNTTSLIGGERAWGYYKVDNSTAYPFVANDTIILMERITDSVSGLQLIGQHNITVFINSTDNHLYNDSEIFSIEYVEVEENSTIPVTYETDRPITWLNLKVHNLTAVQSVDVDFMWNGTEGNVTQSFDYNYTSTVFVPLINSENTVTNYWNYTYCTYDGDCYQRQLDPFTTEVKYINFSYCTGGNVTLVISAYNESGAMNPVNFNLGMSVKIGLYSKHYNFTLSGANSYKFCISPSDEQYVADIDIEYDANGYSTRHYFIREANLTNTTTYVDLFLLEDELSNQIDFTIRDKDYKDQENVIVKAMRYFPGLGNYKIVGMGITGPNGKTSIFLTKDRYYKWLLERDNKVLKLTAPETLTDDTVYLYIEGEDIMTFFKYYNKIAYNCYDDDANKLFVCTYSDTSGILQTMTLELREQLLFNRTDAFCTKTSTASADTLICPYAGHENSTILYTFKGSWQASPESLSILDSGYVCILTKYIWGLTNLGENGIIISLILIVSIFCLGLYNPTASIVLGIFGLVTTVALGLISISMSVIIGIIAVSGFIIIKMRS